MFLLTGCRSYFLPTVNAIDLIHVSSTSHYSPVEPRDGRETQSSFSKTQKITHRLLRHFCSRKAHG